MNKRVEMMCLGDVFVLDNGVMYVVVGCGDNLIQPAKARPCLRLTHNLARRIDNVPIDMVGRCVEWHELDQRIHEYQLSVLKMKHGDVVVELAGQAYVAGAHDGTPTPSKSADEERCQLWLKRFRRAVTDADPTAMYTLNADDLTALERVLDEFARFKSHFNAAHGKLDAAGVVFSPLVRRVECLIAERDQAKAAKVVVDGPRAKYINDALDKAGVPQTFGGNDAILFDRVEWLINQRNELTSRLATTTAELQATRHRSSINEVFARISKALEALRPTFDAIEVTIAIRDSLEKCAQTTAAETTTNGLDKALAEANTRVNVECGKVRTAGRKMVRKAWELIQAARITVDNVDVRPNAPRNEPTSLLDVFEFAQQQHEIADRELCAINEDNESHVERAAYLRGVATAHAHVMALIAALGTRGFELIQHKFTE